MDLSNLDPDVAQHVAKAYATFRERLTENPDIAKREPYVGPNHNHGQAIGKPRSKALTVDTAFDLIIRNKELLLRNQGCATTDEVVSIWQDYKHLYRESVYYTLPADEIAAHLLSNLIVRDVFIDAQTYIMRKRHPRSAPQERSKGMMESIKNILTSSTTPNMPTPEGNPFGLLLKTAAQYARWCRNAPHDIARGQRFLRDFGFYLEGLPIQKMRDMRRAAKETHAYSRTYL